MCSTISIPQVLPCFLSAEVWALDLTPAALPEGWWDPCHCRRDWGCSKSEGLPPTDTHLTKKPLDLIQQSCNYKHLQSTTKLPNGGISELVMTAAGAEPLEIILSHQRRLPPEAADPIHSAVHWKALRLTRWPLPTWPWVLPLGCVWYYWHVVSSATVSA